MATILEAKDLICEMCRTFYNQGWVTGTGGGISIRVQSQIVMAPSGVQKERMQPDDMFVLDSRNGKVLEAPQPKPAPHKPPKLSECAPLFQAAYDLRGAGAVLHSHSLNAVLATLLDENAPTFSVTHLEMIKGIAGHGYHDSCVVPIIENTARECELTDRLREAIQAYPKSNAVLVRRHGVYVWGSTWMAAKTQAECYHYLFEAAVRMRGMGIDPSKPLRAVPAPCTNGFLAAMDTSVNTANGSAAIQPAKKRKLRAATDPTAVVLDIEGTLVPLSFTEDILYPYAATHLRSHLEKTWDTPETQADVQAVKAQVEAGGKTVMKAPVPPISAGKNAVVSTVIYNISAAMSVDEKTGAVKSLQGHIWHDGMVSGELTAKLFEDVLPALKHWYSLGIKIYIYSSGSRAAQADVFAHTQHGDIREYLSGFFDTTSGAKVEAESYKNIALSIGTEPSNLIFATDIVGEAVAAQKAGWRAVIVDRPGNRSIPYDNKTPVIESLDALLPSWGALRHNG